MTKKEAEYIKKHGLIPIKQEQIKVGQKIYLAGCRGDNDYERMWGVIGDIEPEVDRFAAVFDDYGWKISEGHYGELNKRFPDKRGWNIGFHDKSVFVNPPQTQYLTVRVVKVYKEEE